MCRTSGAQFQVEMLNKLMLVETHEPESLLESSGVFAPCSCLQCSCCKTCSINIFVVNMFV